MNILSTNGVSDLSVSYTKQPDSNTDWYCKHVHINQINKEYLYECLRKSVISPLKIKFLKFNHHKFSSYANSPLF